MTSLHNKGESPKRTVFQTGTRVWGLAVDGDNNLIGVDHLKHAVIKYTTDPNLSGRDAILDADWLSTKVLVANGDHSKISSPVGVVVDPDGSVLVANANKGAGVMRFTKPGTADQSDSVLFGGERGCGIALDNNRNIYVMMFDERYVLKIARDGKEHMLGKGQSIRGADVTVLSNGFVLIADTANDRIAVIRNNGIVATWKIINHPGGLTIDMYDNVYVCEHGTGMVWKIETDEGEITSTSPIATGVPFVDGNVHPYSDIAVVHGIE
jgi:sugar lactone lactonase YvrE